MKTILKHFAVVTVFGLGLTGCGDTDTSDSGSTTLAKSDPKVEVTKAWARTSPSMATAGAAYVTMKSTGADKLLSVSADPTVAGTVEIHETVAAESSSTTMGSGSMGSGSMGSMGSGSTGSMGSGSMGAGEMKMQPVKSIELPAGKMVELKPGGYHIMLMELKSPLKVGDKIKLTLTFEKAAAMTIDAEVRDQAP